MYNIIRKKESGTLKNREREKKMKIYKITIGMYEHASYEIKELEEYFKEKETAENRLVELKNLIVDYAYANIKEIEVK